MKLTKVWIVRDPDGNKSMMCDILFEQEIARLDFYIMGSPNGAWQHENHTVYTEYEEAYWDARIRLNAVNANTLDVV